MTIKKFEGEVIQDIREIEAQSRSQLIEKAVLDTANDIVKKVMEKNAEKINENMYELIRAAVREEMSRSFSLPHPDQADTSILGVVQCEVRKFLDEKYAEHGTPFLEALEAGEATFATKVLKEEITY